MRALSVRQAAQCEGACTPRCRCRCGGKLHGAARVPVGEDAQRFFENLPAEDPHARPDRGGQWRLPEVGK